MQSMRYGAGRLSRNPTMAFVTGAEAMSGRSESRWYGWARRPDRCGDSTRDGGTLFHRRGTNRSQRWKALPQSPGAGGCATASGNALTRDYTPRGTTRGRETLSRFWGRAMSQPVRIAWSAFRTG